MNRLIAAAAVLLMGTTARADMGMPDDRYIPVRVTLTADPPPPGVVLFVRGDGPVRRLPVGPPILIESSPRAPTLGVYIYAVSESVMEGWPAGTLPPRDWFERPENPDYKKVVASVWKGRVGFDDSRSAVEIGCRLITSGDGYRLVQTFVNEGSGLYRGVVGFGVCCGIPIGVAGLGLWLVRGMFRPRFSPHS